MPPDLSLIQEAFGQRQYLLSAHASERAAERGIRSHEIEEAVLSGKVIEDYPNDKYGPSCLISGYSLIKRPLHIQVSYPPKVKVITVYEPTDDEWDFDYEKRIIK